MSRQTTLFLALIIVLALTAFTWYRRQRPAPVPSSAAESQSLVSINKKLSDLRRLKDLRLDTSILSDPLFKFLQEPEATVTAPAPQDAGRPNPFLPF